MQISMIKPFKNTMGKTSIYTLLCLLIVNISTFAQTLQDGIKYTENEQFETATKTFKSLLKGQPNNGDIYYYLGENYFKNEDIDSALYYYKKGLEIAVNNPLNYIGLGKILQYEGKTSEAKVQLDKALSMGAGKNTIVLLKVAEVLIKAPTQDLDQAAKLLEVATKLEPKNPEVYILTGDLYLEKTDGNNAIANYKKAQDLDKSSVKAILRVGQLYGRAKNYTLALDKYQDAAKVDSSFAPAYREQGELYYMAKQYEKAKTKYKRYLDLAGNNFSAKQRYASFLFLNKEYKESIALFNELQKQDTTKNFVNRLLAYSLYETGDYPNGTIYINRFFNRAPIEKTKIIASDFEYRGKLFSKTGKDSLAIVDLEQAIKMDTSKVDLYSDMGAIYLKMKQYSNSVKSYERKLKATNKLNANDYFSMGRAYYFNKDFVNADTCFGTVIKLQNTLPIGYLWRAKASIQLDPDSKLGLAKPYFEKYVELTTDSKKFLKELSEAYEYLGYYFMLQKDSAKAKEIWLKLKEIDPNNAKAQKALDSLK
jgi:tetratricopeptide (TPR) repeat protein